MKRLQKIGIFFMLILTSVYSGAQVIEVNALDTFPVYKDLEKAIQNPDDVYRLDLSRNKLTVIPEDVFKLKNLNELILDKNKLTAIPSEIAQLKNLQILSCQHNEIEKIPGELLTNSHLKKLDLADNIIDAIPDGIDQLKELEVLSLWDNPVAHYPESLSDLPNLKFLDLLHNQINYDTQERLKSTLPNVKVIMSPPCTCEDGGE